MGKNYCVHLYLRRRFGEKERLRGMTKKRGIAESGTWDSGRGQTVAVTDGHEGSSMSGGYSGTQRVIWCSGLKSIGYQDS